MDRETAQSVFKAIEAFKYTSLAYSEPDEILNSDLICFNYDAIVLCTHEGNHVKVIREKR